MTLIFTACGLCLSVESFSQTLVEKHGQLQVVGNRIVNKNGEAVQLRGMSLFWSQWMSQYYNYDAIKWLRDDWACTVVRAAMAVDEGGYATNPEAEKSRIKTVVNAAIDLGIYVIIDFHVHDAPAYKQQALEFFSEMAQTYGDKPNVIYEPWNEPSTQGWASIIKPYHESIIAEIRKYDPDNIIVCGNKTWSQDVDEVSLNPIKLSNIAYTVHFYAGTHKQANRDKVKTALDNQIAIFVTEYGTPTHTGDGAINETETKAWWAFLDDHKISHANWSIADKVESSAALKPGASASGGWPVNMLTPSGLMVREEIRTKFVSDELKAPSVQSSISYCMGDVAASLSASGTNLKWYTQLTGGDASLVAPTPSTSSAGTTSYYVAQSMNGFEGERSRIDVNIELPLAKPTTTADWPASVSYNETVELSIDEIQGAVQYLWTVPEGFEIVSNENTSSIEVQATSGIANGDITVNAVNACGQGQKLVFAIFASKAAGTVTLSNLNQGYSGDPQSVTVTTVPAGLDVEILYDGSSTSPSEVGEYEVTATIVDDNYTGEGTATYTIMPPTSVNNLEKSVMIRSYPNPISEKAIIDLGSALKASVIVTDVIGRVIWRETVLGNFEINLEDQAAGLYFIMIKAEGEKVGILKIVKQ